MARLVADALRVLATAAVRLPPVALPSSSSPALLRKALVRPSTRICARETAGAALVLRRGRAKMRATESRQRTDARHGVPVQTGDYERALVLLAAAAADAEQRALIAQNGEALSRSGQTWMRCRCPFEPSQCRARMPVPIRQCTFTASTMRRCTLLPFKHDSKRDRFKPASNRTQSCDHLHCTRTCPNQVQALVRMWPVSVSTWLVRILRMSVAQARHWAGAGAGGIETIVEFLRAEGIAEPLQVPPHLSPPIRPPT